MGTTKEDIRGWLERGKAQGATHLIVVVDEFDHDDYPTYVMPGQSAAKRADEVGQSSMQRVMEVYALHLPWDGQLAEHRSFHYEAPPPSSPRQSSKTKNKSPSRPISGPSLVSTTPPEKSDGALDWSDVKDSTLPESPSASGSAPGPEFPPVSLLYARDYARVWHIVVTKFESMTATTVCKPGIGETMLMFADDPKHVEYVRPTICASCEARFAKKAWL